MRTRKETHTKYDNKGFLTWEFVKVICKTRMLGSIVSRLASPTAH